uniref:Ribonuclease H-like domain, reverse transcriptase, RNA-dependent DNA polymerase n=1 Tax=Tanacetum cinerariifolium TaxID=118510 RepID=A0A6L2JEV5_TANCI|nr:ribonuclease H-like domain, reverse transcriptase, RNA-dependent DNA polymerase [Tanacetum cinerariifolium]
MAFISSAKNSNGKEEVNTASIPTASTNVSIASANIRAASISQGTACAYIASQTNGSQIKFEDINQIDEDDIEEMDIKWNMALLSMRIDRYWKRTGKKITIQGWDWSFMANEEEYHALVAGEEAPTEFALMAKTSADSDVIDNSLCSKTYKKNTDSLNSKITDLTDKLSDSENMMYHYKLGLSQVEESNPNHLLNSSSSASENGESTGSIISKPEIKFVRHADSPTVVKTDKKETVRKTTIKYAELYRKNDKKSNVRGNISYLSDYEPFNGGYVSFSQGGCKITGKGTIKTECIVLGRNFKLIDDTNVLLRTPRQHNMYSINLNNIVPHKDLTCLVAKVSVDECMLWHRRLGHLNFKTMNKLVRHNLVRGLPTKCFENDNNCTACLKGKQHKASLTDDFSRFTWTFFLKTKDETSGILRNLITEIENLKELRVKIIRCDNGGTKEAAGQDVKKDMSSLRYIVLPNWFHEAHLETSTSNAQDACNADAPGSSGNFNHTATSTNPLADHMETLAVETPIPTVSSLVPTAYLNDSLEPSCDTRLISKSVTSQDDTPSLDNILTLTNKFEDILGVTTNTDDTNEVEADLGNMETTITASPTPTLRIHKDHPKRQIIGPNVWSLVNCPKGVKPIGTKWILKNKKDERGIVIKNKARLVAQGHTQEEGIDYDEVFTPVATIEAIRLFLAYASFMGFIPLRFQDPEFPARVYKMEKAMYRLHQAPRSWYGRLSKYLLKNDVRSANTPMDKENLWGKDRIGKDVDLHLYRSMIGSLMYLTASRTDIMFAVCACARHQVTPKEFHLHAVKRIFRYLKGHPKLGLWYPKESPFDLVAFSDSDYGGATQDLKSTTRGCQFLGRRLISWECKKHTIVATLTTEAEYVADASGCGQVLWIQN